VEGLERLRREASPLALIGAWLLLETAAIAVKALAAGEPSYAGEVANVQGAVTVTVVLAALVLFRSSTAWWLSYVYAWLSVSLSGASFVIEPAAKPLLVGALGLAAVWVLTSDPVQRYTRGDRPALPTPAEPAA
jgi:hypothetical protein